MNEEDNKEVIRLINEIRETWGIGGDYAHNLVSLSLRELAVIDQEAAQELYDELCHEGGF